jgi:tRNA-splicing ligase RtcB (3'-phosphate/5'-hydroxy nucleic acid ligase)
MRYRLPVSGAMRVPGIVYTSPQLHPDLAEGQALQQVANVATLPGIVEASYAMPDMHSGYGFPIGGVAATDPSAGGVVSPGGVGFDISCGVRLLAAPVTRDELGADLAEVMAHLDRTIPRGAGPGGLRTLGDAELDAVLTGGAAHLVAEGSGDEQDLTRCEDEGAVPGADPAHVSTRARQRGRKQAGSLGSGNHFLEVQYVDTVHDAHVADAFGLEPGQVCVMIHCGSRGLGHQVCTDHVDAMQKAMARYGIEVPDKQLACAPVDSPEGRDYLGAMTAAANFGLANRQLLGDAAREAFRQVLGNGGRALQLVYDVSHNLAKIEEHEVDGQRRTLCIHRKGATRAWPPGHPDLPEDLRDVGQPVLVPGSMGTGSYVLVGTERGGAFHSSAHGAGRTMSRAAARKRWRPRELRDELEAAGILVRASSQRELPEEAPGAYKDVDEVVRVSERAGLARPVVRLRPLGVVKG